MIYLVFLLFVLLVCVVFGLYYIDVVRPMKTMLQKRTKTLSDVEAQLREEQSVLVEVERWVIKEREEYPVVYELLNIVHQRLEDIRGK